MGYLVGELLPRGVRVCHFGCRTSKSGPNSASEWCGECFTLTGAILQRPSRPYGPCQDAATERRGRVASFPLPPPPVLCLASLDPSHRAAWTRRLLGSSSHRTYVCRSA